MAANLPFFTLAIILAIVLRTVSIYISSEIILVEDKGLPIAAAIGIFGGLLAMLILFLPFAGILIFLLDYTLVKKLYNTKRLYAIIIVILAGLVSQVPLTLIQIL